MQTTVNLGLKKPELTDPPDITAFGDNWDIIEEALTEIDSELSGLAAALEALL